MKKKIFIIVSLLFLVMIASCGKKEKTNTAEDEMNKIAESFVKLSFNLEKFDNGYVDAYFGPGKLKEEAVKENKTLEQIIKEASSLVEKLGNISLDSTQELPAQRRRSLAATLTALKARAEMKAGKKMSFDEESKILYGVVSPTFPMEYYEEILSRLDALLPGKATGKSLADRFNDFRKQFIIPAAQVDAVFKAAIAEGRKRTKEHIKLPEKENFRLEYVTDKPWGAYNWFKGDAVSLIQVSIDLPIYIERALDLACHEGYPGHHVYSALIEQALYKEKGWLEFSLYPLYSPQSLLMEGTANFGIDTAFPGKERKKFEAEVLFPLAGLNPGNYDVYSEILQATASLTYAKNDTARLYVNGKISRDQALERLMRYQLFSRERAEKYVDFIEAYGAYIITYNVGLDMVKACIEKRVGSENNPQKRWQEFKKLLSRPLLPQDLKE